MMELATTRQQKAEAEAAEAKLELERARGKFRGSRSPRPKRLRCSNYWTRRTGRVVAKMAVELSLADKALRRTRASSSRRTTLRARCSRA